MYILASLEIIVEEHFAADKNPSMIYPKKKKRNPSIQN